MRMSPEEWAAYCEKSKVMRERGVCVGDVLLCVEAARPRLHHHTKKPCVRICEHCVIDGTGPRYFVHGYNRGLVAYVPEYANDLVLPDVCQVILPNTSFRVEKRFEHSVILKRVE